MNLKTNNINNPIFVIFDLIDMEFSCFFNSIFQSLAKQTLENNNL